MRKSLKWFVLAALPLFAACATSGTTASSDDVRGAVARDNAAFTAALNAGRLDDAMAFYAPDAMVLATNAPPITGIPAIRSFWNTVAGMKMRDVVITTEQLEVHGDVAIETGSYAMTLNPPGAPGAVTDRGKFLVVWKRQSDGSWKIYRDMFNTNLPMH